MHPSLLKKTMTFAYAIFLCGVHNAASMDSALPQETTKKRSKGKSAEARTIPLRLITSVEAARVSLNVGPLQAQTHWIPKGHRPYMEDTHCVTDDGRFAATFDGHGGSAVSTYLMRNINSYFFSSLPEKEVLDEERAKHVLRRALERIDEDVQRVRHWSSQGSTAVATFVYTDERKGKSQIIAANVGDSRAILCRNFKAIEMTKDHKPNDPTEKNRIESLGGSVRFFGFYDYAGYPIESSGVYRINGNMAVSRAIGDRIERPFVSGEVDVFSYDITAEEDQFMILATDGLWDVMTSQEAVDYVNSVMTGSMGALREGGSKSDESFVGERPVDVKISDWTKKYAEDRGMIRAAMLSRKQKMARYLLEEALRRGTTDNVTVVVVWFQ